MACSPPTSRVAGFTGARRILEGDRGFFRAMSTEHDESRITDGLGARWKISENCYKVWACCGHTHTAIDVALRPARTTRLDHERRARRDRRRPHRDLRPGIRDREGGESTLALCREVQHRVLRRRRAALRRRATRACFPPTAFRATVFALGDRRRTAASHHGDASRRI